MTNAPVRDLVRGVTGVSGDLDGGGRFAGFAAREGEHARAKRDPRLRRG